MRWKVCRETGDGVFCGDKSWDESWRAISGGNFNLSVPRDHINAYSEWSHEDIRLEIICRGVRLPILSELHC